jgi:hypothetical protein
MVPASWVHPEGDRGPKPLFEGPYSKSAAQFLAMANEKGLQEAVDYFGQAPVQEDYMPDFEPGTATHLMMYETCSEGTPISPAFATPEELAHWLADNNASAFGREGATYEQWLATCKSGFAPSAVFIPGQGLMSGVAALTASGSPGH